MKILVVDDDPAFRALSRRFLESSEFDVGEASTAAEALRHAAGGDWDAVCLDLGLPDRDGLEVLKELREHNTDLPVVVLTADAAVQTVVNAMQAGAFDYLSKPIDRTRLTTACKNATEHGLLKRRLDQLENGPTRHGIIGSSDAMVQLLDRIDRVGASDISVLVRGDSGSGKELVARALHRMSRRSSGAFVAINCAAIAESLQESELFGHEKGAFTGALQRRVGRFEEADGGTMFLDEVAELTPSLQAKLLRVLQERVFSRLGSNEEIKSDFRIVAASHKDLHQEAREGRFREDLLYRLAVFELEVPPLRERRSDIPLLVQHFLQTMNPGRRPPRLAPDALSALMAHSWPGNVRELLNTLQHANVLADDEIGIGELPARMREASDVRVDVVEPERFPELTLEALEQRAIEACLRRTNGNLTEATRRLGIGRTTLYRKLKKYGLSA